MSGGSAALCVQPRSRFWCVGPLRCRCQGSDLTSSVGGRWCGAPRVRAVVVFAWQSGVMVGGAQVMSGGSTGWPNRYVAYGPVIRDSAPGAGVRALADVFGVGSWPAAGAVRAAHRGCGRQRRAARTGFRDPRPRRPPATVRIDLSARRGVAGRAEQADPALDGQVAKAGVTYAEVGSPTWRFWLSCCTARRGIRLRELSPNTCARSTASSPESGMSRFCRRGGRTPVARSCSPLAVVCCVAG